MPIETTVSNTSCLISLETISQLGILEKLYGKLDIPPAVALEWGKKLPSWIIVQSINNQAILSNLRMDLGPGEAEAIALALELSASRIILDDKKARGQAGLVGLAVTGTVGVIVTAKTKSVISLVKPLLDDLERPGFYLSGPLKAHALQIAWEYRELCHLPSSITTRKPIPKFDSSGDSLFLEAERQPLPECIHDPPRSTRSRPVCGPCGSSAGLLL